MKDNLIKDKSFRFAVRVINLCKFLVKEHNEYIISKQIFKSGTSIGAMVRESEHAESKPDFIHKLSIALKEATETEYWLLLLKETDYIKKEEFDSIRNDNIEIIKLLTSIINTSKK